MRTEINCYRHGNALSGNDDLTRPLSSKGQGQVEARRAMLGEPNFDLVISSPATRTIQTVSGIAGVPIKNVGVCPKLYWAYDPELDDAMTRMFADLQYASLREYLFHRLGQFIESHGIVAWERVLELSDQMQVPNILLGGHAVLLPAMAYAATRGKSFLEILDIKLDEAQGFVITLEGSRLSNFRLITD